MRCVAYNYAIYVNDINYIKNQVLRNITQEELDKIYQDSQNGINIGDGYEPFILGPRVYYNQDDEDEKDKIVIKNTFLNRYINFSFLLHKARVIGYFLEQCGEKMPLIDSRVRTLFSISK